MNREHHDELIDLGAASVDTKGTPFGSDDRKGGLIPVAGLNDE
ncbi:benenodin family lasso peptide [Sphingomonas sp. URHD0057]|nr:benenodin family lasso peptide [Sphingomonas sp. URHD0057]